MRLTNEDLIEIVKMAEKSTPIIQIASHFKCVRSTIIAIVRKYKKHGVEGILHKRKPSTFSPEVKLEVIKRYNEGESMCSLAVELNTNHSVISSWIKKYEQFGYNGFINERGSPVMSERGRPKKGEKKENNISAPLTYSEREELNMLRKRNKRLEMEIEATKKLHALVQERINRQTRKK